MDDIMNNIEEYHAKNSKLPCVMWLSHQCLNLDNKATSFSFTTYLSLDESSRAKSDRCIN